MGLEIVIAAKKERKESVEKKLQYVLLSNVVCVMSLCVWVSLTQILVEILHVESI